MGDSRIDVPWWNERHQGVLQSVRQGNVDLLMVGDSITHRWPQRALENWNETFAKWNVVNLGFGGDRTEHLVWRLQNGEVDDISPKVAVLMIGTNNTGHNMDAANETLQGIEAVLFELRTRLPSTKILLLAIFPRGEHPDDPMRIRNNEINMKLPDLADDEHIFFMNINDNFIEEDGTISAEIMPDFLHPYEVGYGIWSKALSPTLNKMMSAN